MNVGEVCNRNVVVAGRTAGVSEAARLMRTHHVGDVVVVDRRQGTVRPVGIVTDRDLVVEVLAQGVAAETIAVDDVMTSDVATALEDDDILETLHRMRSMGVRRMPVVNDDGGLEGLIAVDDLLELVAESMNDVVGLISREQAAEVQRRP